MKIGVVSDIHIPSTCEKLPDALLDGLRGVDMIIHAGDLTEPYVLDALKSIAPTEAVSGNMDSPQLIRTLPDKKVLELGGFKIGLIHGWGPPDNLISYIKDSFKEERLDCVIYGHSHRAKIEAIDNVIYFNPGSPTDRIFAPFKSFGILEIDKDIKATIIKL